MSNDKTSEETVKKKKGGPARNSGDDALYA